LLDFRRLDFLDEERLMNPAIYPIRIGCAAKRRRAGWMKSRPELDTTPSVVQGVNGSQDALSSGKEIRGGIRMKSRRTGRKDAAWTTNGNLRARILVLRVLLATIIFLGFAAQLMAAKEASVRGWIGTWASVPVDRDPRSNFQQQTLRQIVNTSIAGTSARIQISNLFGKQP
jgi:hypothetical protein